MNTPKKDEYQRCSVCGKSGPEKACKSCVVKYGTRFDLTTPDGRFQARQVEQGSFLERNRERSEKAEAGREAVIEKLTGKLFLAQEAIGKRRFTELAASLKGIERLAKKLIK